MVEEKSEPAKTASTWLGNVMVQHLAKIVVGLGALLALVWNLRGEFAKKESDFREMKSRVERVEKAQRRLERYLWRQGIKLPPPAVRRIREHEEATPEPEKEP